MSNTILQIPVNKTTRNQAAVAAQKMGFSSLQEVVRLFLNKIAKDEINITFENTVALSIKNDKRYPKMLNDVKSGKVKTKNFPDVKSLTDYLKSEN